MGKPILPYGMFDIERSTRDAKRFRKLESIYHKGQDLAWNGNEVLSGLIAKHGKDVDPSHRGPLKRILSVIMWGELAAWKVAAQLSDKIEALEARMAAVSQAHDEARHFYVMHDYIDEVLGTPSPMPPSSERFLSTVLTANTLPKKILGMQLQLEPTALTIFHAIREAEICPVLSELLPYFEKDEARHVGLGVQMLPSMMAAMTPAERVMFSAYSFKVVAHAIRSLMDLEGDLRALGIEPRRVAILGKSKQMLALNELWASAPGTKSEVTQQLGYVFDAIIELKWSDENVVHSRVDRGKRFFQVLKNGLETVETSLDPACSSGYTA